MKEFFAFAVVGGLGTVTNLVLFFILADKSDVPATAAGVVCFIVAGTQNYIINHLWSFKRLTKGVSLSINKWGAFLTGSLAGLAVNLLVLNGVLYFWELPYKFIAQAAGIMAGMGLNYFISKKVVFRAVKKG